MTMMIRSITDIGNNRNYNDDSCFYDEKKELMVIADGMGGYAGGSIASVAAVKIFQKHYMGVSEESYQQDLNDLIVMCNNEILELAKRNADYNEMGTTLTALCFRDDRYYIGHIGDSRAYLYRDGELIGKLPEFNIRGNIFKMLGEDYVGSSSDRPLDGFKMTVLYCQIDG